MDPSLGRQDVREKPGRFARWLTRQRVPVDRVLIKDPRREAAIAASYAVFYILLAVAIGYLIRWKPLQLMHSTGFITTVWYALVFKLLALLIVPLVWFLRQGYHLRDLSPGWTVRTDTIVSMLISFVAGVGINFLQGRLRMVLEAMRVLPAGEFLLGAGVGALLPLFIAGIPEEVVYRGILQTRLERLLGRLWAILITALLFTAWHLPTRFLLSRGVEGTAGNLGSVLLGTGVPVLIIGLLLGIVWDRYRNLPSLIAFHWGVDTLPTMLAMLGVDF